MGTRATFREFDSDEILKAIETICGSESLAFVVGAGSSMESGLPSWGGLISDLLVDGARSHGLSAEQADEFLSWTLKLDDYPRAGGVAEDLLAGEFSNGLRRRLYGSTADPVPGATASAIAEFCLSRVGSGGLPFIVTTNYDLLLEGALGESLRKRGLSSPAVVSLTDSSEPGDEELSVFHVHGLMAPDGASSGTIILSDRSYDTMQDHRKPEEKRFESLLNESACVFFGSSMTDPNLVRWLHRSDGTGGPHFALFTRQQDAALYDGSKPKVVALREKTQKSKWSGSGLQSLTFDYYSQAAQFAWELAAYANNEANYMPLPVRLEAWRSRARPYVLPRAQKAFEARQEEMHDVLSLLIDDLEHEFRRAGIRGIGSERLQASLWMLDPKNDNLLNVASSDRVWRDRRTLIPERLNWSSEFVATQAFCRGSVVSRSTEEYVATRWNHVVAFPLYLFRPNGRLPVGVLSLGSSQAESKSRFTRGNMVWRQSIPDMLEVAANLLSVD